jgi:arylsulfatase A
MASALVAADPPRPNFVLINIDDLGYADIGPYGATRPTPHLDRLAREGRKLTSHYAAPVCSPSRAALMTGCYAKRVLPIPGVLFPSAAVGLHPSELTIAEVLKGAGYATACIGKWHLGDQPEFLPTRQGFDYYFGLPYSNDMGPASDGSKSNPGRPLPTADEAAKRAAAAKNQSTPETGLTGAAQPPLPLLENEQVVERVRGEQQFTLIRRYTEKAVQFIREHKDGPFFLYLPHTAVHFPHYPAPEFQGKSGTTLFADWVLEVDWSVSQVVNTLRELGLAERTLVFFTSDNGGPVQQGATNTPLRGAKGSTLEGGIRTCTLCWWPGQIPAGTSTDAITSMMDVLPTFARLAGAKLPADRKLDGVDLWPVMSGAAGAPPRDQFYYFRGLALEAVRSGPWKLYLALADGPPAKGKKKLGPARPQLFNLAEDIGESRDVAAEHPEIVARLEALADAIDRDLGRTGIGPGCRPLGRVADPQPLIGHDGTVRAGFARDSARLP